MARPKGTTRAKKAIGKYEFERLIYFVNKTHFIKQQKVRVRLKRVFTLLYLTGCRISELQNFRTKDIKEMIEKKEYSTTNQTKMKQSRLIVFGDNQLQLLKDILPQFEVSIIDVCVSALTKQANDVIHFCLGELYSTHSFRTGYITRLANSGENIELIRSDIGHKNITTTARYIKVTDEQKRAAKEKLDW